MVRRSVVDCRTIHTCNLIKLQVASKEATVLYSALGESNDQEVHRFFHNDLLSLILMNETMLPTCTLLSVLANGRWLSSRCLNPGWWHSIISTVCKPAGTLAYGDICFHLRDRPIFLRVQEAVLSNCLGRASCYFRESVGCEKSLSIDRGG
ncbi:uncharacterized protein M421DRAFT_422961 [Didymella exigua CBS 183.55]|uniref:Uncharacterized protein n=1 Tax=Didymella exigua CBS 183.55 TaxID=1150837 RepID=A0A6A5RL61_9PLEO|nr:uncharacterized protein M421DRAFT_422961 [Didymella exigua CBS 183.55]KAF1926277.1 hypothetical protein M421DRAFT_422961 [Didymella exigua CBS 183.55]